MGDFFHEFFSWLSEHPEAEVLLLFLATITWILVVIWVVVAFVLVAKNGGEIGLWGIKVRTRVVGISANLKIEVGTEKVEGNKSFYEDVKSGQEGSRTLSVPIKYQAPFKEKPKIFLALKTIDVGGHAATGHIHRLRLKTEAETNDGFTLVFETWKDSIVFGDTAATWIAFGE